MINYKEGDKIICIDARPSESTGAPTSVKFGSIYTATEFITCPACGFLTVGLWQFPDTDKSVLTYCGRCIRLGKETLAKESMWKHFRATRFTKLDSDVLKQEIYQDLSEKIGHRIPHTAV